VDVTFNWHADAGRGVISNGQFVEMDANVSLGQQFEEGGGPGILINKFDVDASETDPLLKA
jgi:hypothetical protein